MAEIAPRYHTKNRIAAVDITRLMAAFCVMYIHLAIVANAREGDAAGIVRLSSFIVEYLWGHISYVFLFLAGYFACRNLTWGKACNNAWWTFAPYLLWNAVSICIGYALGSITPDRSWTSLMGFQVFMFTDWYFPFAHPGESLYPANVPLWFMRDLIFLYLLSPILCKYAKWLFPLILISSLIPAVASIYGHPHNTAALLSPDAIATFTAGCFLQTVSKDKQKRFLQFQSMWIIAGYVVMQIGIGYYWGTEQMVPQNLYHILFSTWAFYQLARWIELHIPYAKEFALKFAPVTFLTFAAHWILYDMLPAWGTRLPILYPILVFILCALFFFVLKRWARPLLHLVAHYKLRPDDIKPEPAQADTPSPKTAEAGVSTQQKSVG